MNKLTITTILALAAAACGKSDDKGGGGGGGGGSCGPLKVTIDGAEVTGLGHGLAITQKMQGEASEQVQLFNHDKATCEEVLSKSGRQTPDGEIAVRANAGKSTMMKAIGINSSTQMGIEVKLVGKAPSKPGDKVTLCVPETTFKPAGGEHAGKTITMAGTFEGTYCGVMEF